MVPQFNTTIHNREEKSTRGKEKKKASANTEPSI
jgi:hypothetical protein